MNRLKKNVEKVSQSLEETHQHHVVEAYRVKMGDTLEIIAKNYGTTPETLLKINHLENEKINPGQELLVPSALIIVDYNLDSLFFCLNLMLFEKLQPMNLIQLQ